MGNRPKVENKSNIMVWPSRNYLLSFILTTINRCTLSPLILELFEAKISSSVSMANIHVNHPPRLDSKLSTCTIGHDRHSSILGLDAGCHERRPRADTSPVPRPSYTLTLPGTISVFNRLLD